ncbi:BamA/TamA family outer membrane protein [bacterium]|nr:BamA/TamA family outer membrane protein [bacterium]HPF34690.1 BamA/TamA family outer membrane protein [Candidatus Krumholzibacteria bacterium]HRX51761.1 BamA/TamA family outer membrane protein [Candidatus Krumholzibacteria bacterium]
MTRLLVLLTALLAALPAAAQWPAEAWAEDQTFGDITIRGNASTSAWLIRNELLFASGDAFDMDLVDATWEHLEDLGWFAFVDISLDDEMADAVPVTVTVEEDQTFRYYPVIDYDRRWDILLGARAYDVNLRGRGEQLSITGIWHAPHRYTASWSHPWLFGVRGLSWGLDGMWEDAEFVYRDFDHRRWQARAHVRWQPRGTWFAEAGATRAFFRQEGDFLGAPSDWSAGERTRWILEGTLGLDMRDLAWYPTRGRYHALSLRRHVSDDFADFTELRADLREFVPTPWGHVLALHARGRRVSGPVPPEDMLFWGGPETLRGFHYAQLEGEEGWLLSAEYRWPIFLMPISADGRVIGIGLHAFYDQGANWWDGGSASPRHDWGAGAHINISAHQFRFEVARTDDGRTAFQFMDSFNF